MAAKSKFFRVGTEGDTADGRKIERSWIQQMADHFDRNLYGARVWLEHLRSPYPDSAFKAYGDVLAVKADELADGRLVGLAHVREELPHEEDDGDGDRDDPHERGDVHRGLPKNGVTSRRQSLPHPSRDRSARAAMRLY